MRIRFLADNDLRFSIVKAVWRREPAVDFASAQDSQIDGLADPAVLETASQRGRILITHDRRTMLYHFRNHLAEGKSSPGLLVVSQEAPLPDVVEAIVVLWAVAEPEELQNQAFHLPAFVRHVFPR